MNIRFEADDVGRMWAIADSGERLNAFFEVGSPIGFRVVFFDAGFARNCLISTEDQAQAWLTGVLQALV